MSPEQKGIETRDGNRVPLAPFTMSPDQKGIETAGICRISFFFTFTMSPDQKGIETRPP